MTNRYYGELIRSVEIIKYPTGKVDLISLKLTHIAYCIQRTVLGRRKKRGERDVLWSLCASEKISS